MPWTATAGRPRMSHAGRCLVPRRLRPGRDGQVRPGGQGHAPGLEEKPDWADTNFRLDDIYGDNAADKKARVDGMVKAAEGEPTNGDLALVVGIHLYCDGKTDQAAPFFRLRRPDSRRRRQHQAVLEQGGIADGFQFSHGWNTD